MHVTHPGVNFPALLGGLHEFLAPPGTVLDAALTKTGRKTARVSTSNGRARVGAFTPAAFYSQFVAT
jgi:hypothetical protein